MNRSLLLAALAALASTGTFAQSSVTVYGRVNTSVENINNNGVKTWQLVNNASRLGFKGTEDLGGGLNAGFQIEHGFNVDTGAASQGSQFWARQSEVNLGSKAAGTVRLGNFTSEAYFATADYVSMHNHDTGTSSDALYAYVGRNTNKVAYRSPDMAGLVFEGAVSLNETQAVRQRSHDVALNYTAGPLHVGFGWEKFGTARQFAVSALYEMGPFTFGGYVQRDQNGYIANGGNRTNIRLSGMYTLGNSEFHVNVGRAGSYANVRNTQATQGTLGYNYNLSKRTKVFAFVTKVNDDAGIYTGDFRSVALGVRHNF